jgi:hypothetical protein
MPKSKNDETEVDREQVRDEHLDEVQIGAHWAYLFGVLVGSFLLMIALIALLGSSSGG